jgi:hypothetical protein
MEAADKAELTFRRERWRSFCSGIIETAGNTFLLLIATRHFDAGPSRRRWSLPAAVSDSCSRR